MIALDILKALLYEDNDVVNGNYVHDYENNNNISIIEAIKELEELQNRSCNRCKDKYSCYIYKTLDEQVTFIVSCGSFEPKE